MSKIIDKLKLKIVQKVKNINFIKKIEINDKVKNDIKLMFSKKITFLEYLNLRSLLRFSDQNLY